MTSETTRNECSASGSLHAVSRLTDDGTGGVTVNGVGISTSGTDTRGVKVHTNPIVNWALGSIHITDGSNGGRGTESGVGTTGGTGGGDGSGGGGEEIPISTFSGGILSATLGGTGRAGDTGVTNEVEQGVTDNTLGSSSITL